MDKIIDMALIVDEPDLPPEGALQNPKDFVFSHVEIVHAVKSLSLNSVAVGDYFVVMSGEADTTICGEPYLALQLWLNMSSGDYMGRDDMLFSSQEINEVFFKSVRLIQSVVKVYFYFCQAMFISIKCSTWGEFRTPQIW